MHTLTGTFTRGDGTPERGRVLFSLAEASANSSGVIITGGTVAVTLDGDGAFTVDLEGTDDLETDGNVYHVRERFDGRLNDRTYYIELEDDADLADLMPLASPPNVVYRPVDATAAAAAFLLPERGPGLDIYSGTNNEGGDPNTVYAETVMERAEGYETYPADLPLLGTWDSQSSRLTWTPNAPGIYHWYRLVQMVLDAPPSAAARVSWTQAQSQVLAGTWGADYEWTVPGGDPNANVVSNVSRGVHMASAGMLDASVGGLVTYPPQYDTDGEETVTGMYVLFVVEAWHPGSAVDYLDAI